jgi:aryl-alcohol dehydrogenase-like predicted oxidoreductase
MEYRQLGKSGVLVSTIGLGTNRFGIKVDQAEVDRIMGHSEDVGINFVDTADVYQQGRSEESLGRALKGRWARFVVATKVNHRTGEGPNDRGSSRYHIMNAVEASLRRLQSDHNDLYQLHRWDEDTPPDETLRALDDLVSSGKVRYIGASNFPAWQLALANGLAQLRGWVQLVTVQSHYHMLERTVEREVLPYCAAQGVGFIPYFPLADGFLTGKYQRDQPPPAGSRGEDSTYVQKYMTPSNYERIERLSEWAQARDHSLLDLAHAWLLAHEPVCSVISGATSVDQVAQNARAAGWTLTGAEMDEIESILEG